MPPHRITSPSRRYTRPLASVAAAGSPSPSRRRRCSPAIGRPPAAIGGPALLPAQPDHPGPAARLPPRPLLRLSVRSFSRTRYEPPLSRVSRDTVMASGFHVRADAGRDRTCARIALRRRGATTGAPLARSLGSHFENLGRSTSARPANSICAFGRAQRPRTQVSSCERSSRGHIRGNLRCVHTSSARLYASDDLERNGRIRHPHHEVRASSGSHRVEVRVLFDAWKGPAPRGLVSLSGVLR